MHLLAHTTTTTTAHRQLLARQWLALYQQGPRWVPPLVHTGVLANLYLAFAQPNHPQHPQHPQQQHLHLAAAALAFAVLPLTFLVFEPGINGACKWKAAALLRQRQEGRGGRGDRGEEGGGEAGEEEEEEDGRRNGLATTATTTTLLRPSVRRHSGGAATRAWAERADMAELVVAWARLNHLRWVLALLAGVVSFAGLVVGGGGYGGAGGAR
ncbi:predicted protein [Chaetomium globosum CBS 148.51]|uniref:Uncharacterized protein n=1 Tax=Chaetomium globosum (strain ATCC 6205 / CBS 148.51 / DSM 1962 / NBRC 6347 / NRRL 1970) TaxID=306901 RepID=Q2H2P9_CHAGB|nr:uncharacterized protein CHGG_03947 [Chaetomium globosum CBS 148.51]EAQ87328.1 predicted protein [Chaetomium globosum CBS 148.51]